VARAHKRVDEAKRGNQNPKEKKGKYVVASPDTTLKKPRPRRQMTNGHSNTLQQPASVAWMPDVCVWTVCSQFMVLLNCEAEREQRAELAEAVESKKGARDEEEAADHEWGGYGNLGCTTALGGGIEHKFWKPI